MRVTVIKFSGEEIERDISQFELRRNNVEGWIRLGKEDVIWLKDIATIKIKE